MAFRLPRLPESQPAWSVFKLWWQRLCEAIESQETSQNEILSQLQAAVAAIQAAQDAADLANAAAATATAAAAAAESSAAAANTAITTIDSTLVDYGDRITALETP